MSWECFGLDDRGMPEGQHRWAKTTARAWPSGAAPEEYRNEVRIDWCKVFADGGGPLDLLRIYRHEMAHAKDGRGHYEGSPDPRSPNYNAAYWPITRLTGL